MVATHENDSAETSERLYQFRASPTGEMGALVRKLRSEGRDIIGLVNGEPDFPTAENVKRAGIEAIEANNTRYTDTEGTMALREAIAKKFRVENDLEYSPSQVVVSSGNKPLLHAALLATVRPGDEVIIPTPHWPSHLDLALIAGAKPVCVPCTFDASFRLTGDALERAITPQTRALILNSPNNPTGFVYTREDLLELVSVLKKYPNIWILSDEIYEHIQFSDRRGPSIASLDPEIAARTITANGLSKGYAMTGWRIGFAGGPQEIMRAIAGIISQIIGPPSAISQAAALEALTGDQTYLKSNSDIFRKRRDIAIDLLAKIPGLRCHVPEGAFYLYVDCSALMGRSLPNGKRIESDDDFVRACVEHAGVAFVSGSGFGLSPYFRVAYSVSEDQIRTAMQRLRDFCQSMN